MALFKFVWYRIGKIFISLFISSHWKWKHWIDDSANKCNDNHSAISETFIALKQMEISTKHENELGRDSWQCGEVQTNDRAHKTYLMVVFHFCWGCCCWLNEIIELTDKASGAAVGYLLRFPLFAVGKLVKSSALNKVISL